MEAVAIGGMDYHIDRYGCIHESPNEQPQAEFHPPVTVTTHLQNQEPEHQAPDAPIYQHPQVWHTATDYAFLFYERTHIRRRLDIIDTWQHTGRPPGPEHIFQSGEYRRAD